MPPSSSRDLLRLNYEAILAAPKCYEFLAEFAKAIHAQAAGVLMQDLRATWAVMSVTYGVDNAAVKDYESRYLKVNPWLPVREKRGIKVGEVLQSAELLSPADLENTQFYEEYMKPRDWQHVLSVVIDTTGLVEVKPIGFTQIFAINPESRPFEDHEVELSNYLASHMVVATQLYRRLLHEHLATGADGVSLDNVRKIIEHLLEIPAIDTFRRDFDLTAAETRLAIALFSGQHIVEYARDAYLSISTVRGLVRRLFYKTGVNSLSDLLGLLTKCVWYYR